MDNTEILTEEQKEIVLEAVVLGTVDQNLSDDEVTTLANKVLPKIINNLVLGKIAQMVIDRKLVITGVSDDDGLYCKPRKSP